MTRQVKAILVAALLLVLVLFAAFRMFEAGGARPIAPAAVDFAALTPQDRAKWIERGRQVAQAGDCAACHQSDDGHPLAGGTAIELPVGTLFGTNITSSRQHGIGDWSADDLYRSLVWGIARDGSPLYPAMPYVSYHRIAREDSDALWLFLQSTQAIERPNRPPSLAFPFNVRPAIRLWNALFRPGDVPDGGSGHAAGETPGAAPAGGPSGVPAGGFDRGRYLVDVLGHCGECHTPRNFAMAMKADDRLQGQNIENSTAPDITARGLAERGWTRDDLARFLSTGLAPQGVMAFRMYPVLRHSTRHLPDSDIAAMTGHLLGDVQTAGPVPKPSTAGLDAPVAQAGRREYLGACAGCHGTDGEGVPHSSVRLDVNTTAMLADPLNLVRVTLEGIGERDLARGERMQTMPGFADRLNDEQVAALATYVRRRWGGQETEVKAADVAGIRKLLHGAGSH